MTYLSGRQGFEDPKLTESRAAVKGGEPVPMGAPASDPQTLKREVDPGDEQCYAFNGGNFLDPPSWRHYLPRLIDYALRNIASNAPGTMAIDALLWALRPPDRDPPRLASLNAEQEAVIVAALEQLAFSEDSVYREDAMQVMEEWWIPNALYRPRPDPDDRSSGRMV